MFEDLKHQRELARFASWEEVERRSFFERCEAAKAKGEPLPDEGELAATVFMIQEEKNFAISRHLLRKADRYGVPVPSLEEKGAWEDRMGRHSLTMKSAADLRSAIRREKNERWEFWLKVAGVVVPAVVGIIGALIGLVAVSKK